MLSRGAHTKALFAAVLPFWLLLLSYLAPQWKVYPQYSYGWMVPVLVVYLLWERQAFHLSSNHSGNLAWAQVTLLAAGVLLLPVTVLHEANPIWRLASWAMALLVVAITLVWWRRLGGPGTLRRCLFPILFFLVAVPWPSPVEGWLIHSFTRWNTVATVQLVTLWQVPAVAVGNVIRIPTGGLGIDDACSGIRSFQAILMAGLFLGELGHLTLLRRWLLVGVGVGVSFLSNVLRTSFLVFVAARHDVKVADRWHDFAGGTALVGAIAALAFTAYLLRSKAAGATKATKTGAPGMGQESGGFEKPTYYAGAALAWWVLLVFTLTETWFRSHERRPARGAQWEFTTPADAEALPISPATEKMLAYDRGVSTAWKEGDLIWRMFQFQWYPRRSLTQRVQVHLAKSHRPEICLSAGGKRLVQDFGIQRHPVGNIQLPVHQFLFADAGRPLHVFYTTWEEHTPLDELGNKRSGHSERLRAALKGNRATGQRVLEVALWGTENVQEAHTRFAQLLPAIVRVKENVL